MESIGRGECPQELEPASRDLPVTVNLVRSRADYTPPARPAYTAFHGTGRTLAGAHPAVPPCPVSGVDPPLHDILQMLTTVLLSEKPLAA